MTTEGTENANNEAAILPPGVTFRRLRESDSFDELTTLLHEAYRPLAEAGMNFTGSYQDVETTRKRCLQGECWLGVIGERVISTVVVYFPYESETPWYGRAEVAVLGQLAVKPGMQRMGIGAAMIALCERRAREMGARELALDTSEKARDLIEFYTRRGFRLVERAQWKGKTYASVILSKRLASEEQT